MKNKNDDLFINMLLQETYKFVPEDEVSKGHPDLLNYFNKCEEDYNFIQGDLVLINFLEKYCENLGELDFIEEISCFRMKFLSYTFDLPKNWGSFKKLYQSIEFNNNFLSEIEEDDTGFKELLLKIERDGNDVKKSYYLINFDKSFYMASIDCIDKDYFCEWIMKYLGLDHRPFEFTDAA